MTNRLLDGIERRPGRERPAARLGSKAAYLSATDIFRDLAPREVQEIDRTTAMSTCKKGRVIYQPDRTGEALFILKKGRVNLYRITADGRKLITGTIMPGTIFGEMGIIGQGMEESFAEAAEDCTLCVMSRADVEHLVLTKPQVGLRIMEVMARRLRDAEERLESLTFKSVPARLASLLLRLSGGTAGSEVRGLSHQDIAEMIGSYRETVSRILGEFRAEGIIDMRRMGVRILDPGGLAAIAEA